eukprot:TRINITY_DN12049_c0_g1::TRINITY_DN12049_c0_g1_i1::g.9783::m.9783 TRINITY_DN12049_c0_g1::TRINITY_DN12049_c0_g1_i1::g.9783  ORF type:complete len:191 (-),score=46.30,sp/O48670/RER1A_ARATH/55.21/1e-60,Rer1/PF03248.8/2.2e-62,Pox_P35/PF03213.9/1.4 TRINITY_DN12049_c0_g1_i1:444-977(-)
MDPTETPKEPFYVLLSQKWQTALDKTAPHPTYRWLFSIFLLIVYVVRAYFHGFHIVSYALGIFLLNMLIGFLTPQMDLDEEGPCLPQKDSDEFKPFVRRLPEYKFWNESTKGIALSIFATFFSFFDVPVFWPILLMYFIILFVLTMKKQLLHMWKYKYIPFDFGKKKYTGEPKAPAP